MLSNSGHNTTLFKPTKIIWSKHLIGSFEYSVVYVVLMVNFCHLSTFYIAAP